jgi:hypothetical protein
MNVAQTSTIDSGSQESPARCQHRTLKGRCRQAAIDSAGTLCFHHARVQRQAKDDFTLLEPLVRKTNDLQSIEGISEDLAGSIISSPKAASPLAAPPSSLTSIACSSAPSSHSTNGTKATSTATVSRS